MLAIVYFRQMLVDEFLALRKLFQQHKYLIFILLIGFVAVIYFLKPFPPRTITLATSHKNSDYYLMGNYLVDYFKERGIELVVKETGGSIENANLLADPSSGVDAALVLGGSLSSQQAERIESLGSVAFEPVWIFYKKSLASKIHTLKDFENYKVGIGPKTGGPQALAKKIFNLNGVDIEKNSNFKYIDYAQEYEDFASGQLDAVVISAVIVSPKVQQLLNDPNVALFGFENAKGYEMKVPYLDMVTLAKSSVSIEKTIPAQDIPLIATTANLLVRKNLHPDLQTLLLMAAKDTIRASDTFFAKRGEFPAYVDTSVKESPQAIQFYEFGPPVATQYLPYWLAGFMSRSWVLILTMVAFIYPLFKLNLGFSAFQYRMDKLERFKNLTLLERNLGEFSKSSEELERCQKQLDQMYKSVLYEKVPIGSEPDREQMLVAIVRLRTMLNLKNI